MAFCMMRKGGWGGASSFGFLSLYTFPFVVEVLDLDAIKFWSGYSFVFWLMRSTPRERQDLIVFPNFRVICLLCAAQRQILIWGSYPPVLCSLGR